MTTVNNVISKEHAYQLSQTLGHKEFTHPIIEPIVQKVGQYHKVSTQFPAYCTVESKKDGHNWHIDTGNNDHMLWCTASASILLTPPTAFTGGAFYFQEDQPIYHYLDMVVYASDVRHKVDPHTGDRKVLLMFFT